MSTLADKYLSALGVKHSSALGAKYLYTLNVNNLSAPSCQTFICFRYQTLCAFAVKQYSASSVVKHLSALGVEHLYARSVVNLSVFISKHNPFSALNICLLWMSNVNPLAVLKFYPL